MAYPPGQEGMSRSGLPMVACPTLFAVDGGNTTDPSQATYRPIELNGVNISIDIHISTIFATFEYYGRIPPGPKKAAGIFLLPKHRDAVVTECKIDNMTRKKTYITAVMPKKEMEKIARRSGKKDQRQSQQLPADPELFHLNIPQMNSGDEIKLLVSWFWPMDFRNGQFVATVPAMFSSQMLGGKQLGSMATLTANINSGFEEPVSWQCMSHSLKVTNNYMGKVELISDPSRQLTNGMMIISYQCPNKGADIGASINVQLARPNDPDQRASFALNLSPPAKAESFPRSIVFVIDRSGSMYGEPLESAKKGIMEALKSLSYNDQFTIIAYDHGQYYWNDSLQSANRSNVNAALSWVQQLTAGGMTDIMTPLQQAVQVLYPSTGGPSATGIPYVFLLTDGAVDNERDIARWAVTLKDTMRERSLPLPRIHTFGVGIYCNHYFLKQLASLSRGLFDVALKPFQIADQIKEMMLSAEKPLLTDVYIEISDGVSDVELYPFPIPDLFSGRPLVVSGRFNGTWPGTVRVGGYLPDGRQWSKEVPTFMEAAIPLSRVFAKQRIDLMAAKAWMDDDAKLTERVVDLSVRENIPCAHTTVISFEADPAKIKEWEKEKKHKGGKMSGGTVAALAIGGAVGVAAVGVALYAFGDVGATMSGLMSGDAMSALGNIGGDIGNFLGGVGEGIADGAAAACDFCGDACGGVCGGVGDFCGDACGNIGDICGGLCEGIGECCGGVGDIVGSLCGGDCF